MGLEDSHLGDPLASDVHEAAHEFHHLVRREVDLHGSKHGLSEILLVYIHQVEEELEHEFLHEEGVTLHEWEHVLPDH